MGREREGSNREKYIGSEDVEESQRLGPTPRSRKCGRFQGIRTELASLSIVSLIWAHVGCLLLLQGQVKLVERAAH